MDYTRVPHASLILKQQGAKLGVWNLKTNSWYRRPFTDSTVKAHEYIIKVRTKLHKDATRVPFWSWR